jgi:hypothetical protein
MQPSDGPRRSARRSATLGFALAFLAPIVGRAAIFPFEARPRTWQTADWSSIGALPPADRHPAARVLVLSGRTGGWKGVFSVHSWIVFKRENGSRWTRYDVVGWGNPVRENGWAPDGRWFGNSPLVIVDIEGERARALIPKIEAAIGQYEFRRPGDYRIWPGPNSNSFVASVLRAIPEAGVALPPNAVGRDYRSGLYLGLTDSRTGIELNLWGVFGFKAGWVEGIELIVLGLVAGIDLRRPAFKVPGYGRIGLPT